MAILQVSIVPHIALFGVNPNLVVAGLPALFYSSNFWEVAPAVIIGGLFYDLSDFYFGLHLLPLLLTFLILWFLSRKYVSSSHFLILGILGTVIFNFLFLIAGYIFGNDSLFDYFLSWRHLIEISLNTILAILFGLAASFIKNRRL